MPKVNDRRLTPVVRLVAGLVLALVAVGAGADELNMTPGVTEISRSIYDLHMLIFWICVIIGIVVSTTRNCSTQSSNSSPGSSIMLPSRSSNSV